MIWMLFGLYLVGNVAWQLLIKKSLRRGKHHSSVTAAILVAAAFASFLTWPLFPIQWPDSIWGYVIPAGVALLLAISARFEVVARKELPVSEVVIVNRLRAVMFVTGAILFLGERPEVGLLLGATAIILANLLVSYKQRTFVVNKHFWQLVLAGFLVVLSTFIDVEISKQFNLGLFMAVSFLIRGAFFVAIDPVTWQDVYQEFKSPGRVRIILTGFALALSVLSTVYGFQRIEYSLFEPLRATATFVTILIASTLNLEDKQDLPKKILASLLVVLGVYLIAS